jgi:hypothetical protein
VQSAPESNGKQENFWPGQIAGRLLPMLEGVADLSLAQLNEATLAWIEMEYNRAEHSELGETPLQRYLHHRDVGRPCPSTAELKLAFTPPKSAAPNVAPMALSAWPESVLKFLPATPISHASACAWPRGI